MSFIEINVVGMNTTIRLGVAVARLVASTASCRKGHLILILIVVFGTVTWLTTVVAETIIGSGNRSLG